MGMRGCFSILYVSCNMPMATARMRYTVYIQRIYMLKIYGQWVIILCQLGVYSYIKI